jgi:hypothetical protein
MMALLCLLTVSQTLGNIISGEVYVVLFQTRYCITQVLTLSGMCFYLLEQEQTISKIYKMYTECTTVLQSGTHLTRGVCWR